MPNSGKPEFGWRGSRPNLRLALIPFQPRASRSRAPLLASCNPSALDVGLGPIGARRPFVVPTTILVLVRDGRALSRHDLFLGRAFRRLAREVVGGEGLGEYPVDPVGPAAVVLDDLVGDLGHV